MSRFYPFLAQNFVLPVYDIVRRTSRFGFGRVLQKSQWFSRTEIERLQNGNLRVLLKHAYETVPYYRRVFRERGLTPSNIKSVDDLAKLPILTKADVRKNFEDLISQSFPRSRLIPYHSGGTGDPVHFYITKESFSWEVAAEFRAYGWAGYRLGDPCFVIWGSPADLSKYKSMISRFTKTFENILTVDAFLMTDEILSRYASLLKKFNPRIVRGYAHSVCMLARYLLERSIDYVRPRAVITSAEILSGSRRKSIEEAFGCPVFDLYGSREVGAIAAECKEHHGYHISAENVVLEFAREGEKVAAGENGVILVTSLRNFGMPFIRYQIGDVGKPSDDVCSCGRGLPLMSSIEGRTMEFLRVYDKSSGRIVPVSPGVFEVALGYLPLKQYRIYQESLKKIVVKAVKGNAYSQEHTDFLTRYVRNYFGDDVIVEIEFVDYLPPMPSGKRPLAVSKVNPFEQ
jgi:phenylacetate-CoA ligase